MVFPQTIPRKLHRVLHTQVLIAPVFKVLLASLRPRLYSRACTLCARKERLQMGARADGRYIPCGEGFTSRLLGG